MLKIKVLPKLNFIHRLVDLFKHWRDLVKAKNLTTDITLALIVTLVAASLANHAYLGTLLNLTNKPKPVVSSQLPENITVSQVQPKTKTTSTPTSTPVATVAPAPKKVSSPIPKATKPVVPSPSSSVNNLKPTSSNSPSNTGSKTGSSTTGSNTGGGSSSPPTPSPSYSSTNWSGYLATTGKFTAVSASWIVPTVTGNGTTVTADATWVGIGGVTSGDLIQIGTEDSVTSSGQVSTASFYEMLPAVSQAIHDVIVNPGDSVSASISEISAGNWAMSFTDNTDNQTFSQDVTYDSQETSAEWIEEDPSYINGQLVPLDNFGAIYFSSCLSTDNGISANLTVSNASTVTLVNESDSPIATPSAVGGDGGSFSITHL